MWQLTFLRVDCAAMLGRATACLSFAIYTAIIVHSVGRV